MSGQGRRSVVSALTAVAMIVASRRRAVALCWETGRIVAMVPPSRCCRCAVGGAGIGGAGSELRCGAGGRLLRLVSVCSAVSWRRRSAVRWRPLRPAINSPRSQPTGRVGAAGAGAGAGAAGTAPFAASSAESAPAISASRRDAACATRLQPQSDERTRSRSNLTQMS